MYIYMYVGAQDKKYGSLIVTITVISVSLLLSLVFIIIFIIVTIILVRGKAKIQRELEVARGVSGGNETVTYEEIHLPPLPIDTSKNVAYGNIGSHNTQEQ